MAFGKFYGLYCTWSTRRCPCMWVTLPLGIISMSSTCWEYIFPGWMQTSVNFLETVVCTVYTQYWYQWHHLWCSPHPPSPQEGFSGTSWYIVFVHFYMWQFLNKGLSPDGFKPNRFLVGLRTSYCDVSCLRDLFSLTNWLKYFSTWNISIIIMFHRI